MRDLSPDRKTIPPFAALRAFEAVGRLSGIRRAAQALSLDHAVVSRHLRSLEEWAGVPLINRMQGGALLTELGAQYHARIAMAFAEIEDATNELTRHSGKQRLSIWCAPGFASQWLMARLGAFQGSHPDIDLELHPTEATPDFSRYEADADIYFRYGGGELEGISQGVRRFEIASPLWIPVANKNCAAALKYVREPADLLRAPLLHEDSDRDWKTWFAAHGVKVNGSLPGPRLWQAQLALDAARHGQGVALANPFLLGDDLDTGRLVALTTEPEMTKPVVLGSYVFAARADRWQSSAIVRFRRWLKTSTAAPVDLALSAGA